MIENINYVICMLIICVGIWGALYRKNILKIIIALDLVDTGVNMFIISLGYKTGGTAPILGPGISPSTVIMVDPIPQALTLTSIVIGASVTALALSLAIQRYNYRKTLEIDFIGGIGGRKEYDGEMQGKKETGETK